MDAEYARQRVRALLRREDGRLRQQTIIERTGWSAAQASRWLSHLEDAGEIERVSLGAEKLVCLPGNVPDIAR